MSLRILPDLEQGTDEWHAQRRGMITASVVGKLITGVTLKAANNDTSRGLIATLAAERITGWTDPTYVSDDMLRGIEDEPIARECYAAASGVDVSEVGFMVRDDYGGCQIGYSPDGLVGDDGLIEIKSRRSKVQLGTLLTDEVPAENMAQLQCGLLVSGRAWIDYVSYCGGMPLYVKRVTADPRWQEAIPAACIEAEQAIADLIAAYPKAVEGRPPTARIDYSEMVI